MTTQHLMTLVIETLVFLFALVAALDFVTGLVALVPTVPSSQALMSETDTSFFPSLSDKLIERELLPEPAIVKEPAQQQEVEQPIASSLVEPLPQLEDNVKSVSPILEEEKIDKLPLRLARKLAKQLQLPQKANGQDIPLAHIRANIKAKLQESEVSREAAEAVRALLTS